MTSSPARDHLVNSLSAAWKYVSDGGLADTALPGTQAAEAMRLIRNGMSVALFASFELFVRERIRELLDAIAAAENRPNFDDLPNELKTAATFGVIEGLRFRYQRQGDVEPEEMFEDLQAQASMIASTRTGDYVFSELAFGQASSNISEGVLKAFLASLKAGGLYDQIGHVLTDVGFDFTALDLANRNGTFSFRKFAKWRHTAAHDARAVLDSSILLGRIRACVAVAYAFDCLASLALKSFMSEFPSVPDKNFKLSVEKPATFAPNPGKSSFTLTYAGVSREFYSVEHGMLDLREEGTAGVPVVVLDSVGYVIEWFYAGGEVLSQPVSDSK